MNERNRNGIHDETGGADEALPQAGACAKPSGTGAGATSRAFVVEVASEVTDTGAFRGRVQHLTTFDGGNFNSAESLISIIRRVLDRAGRNELDK